MQLLTAKRNFPVTRKYEAACKLRVRERERFTLEYRRRFGSTARIHYPTKYQQLSPFVDWLHVEVGEVARGTNEPDTDVMEASKLPKIVATA
jgi:hypothetical protein